MNPNQKFRPYFTHSELLEIIRCVKKESKNTVLLRYLEMFRVKISSGLIDPSLTLGDTIGKLVDGLELESSTELTTSLSAKREASYKKWISSPESCTLEEIADCHIHRYENNLMTPEEEAIYERTL